MLQVKDLHYSIGERELLSGISWAIQPQRRVALIGPNGAGKTTLFKIITGEIGHHKGSIAKSKNFRIGYLPQEEVSVSGDTVLFSVLEGQQDITTLEKKIAEVHRALKSSPADPEDLLKQLGTLEHRFETMGGYRLEASAKTVLSGLGFTEGEFSRQLSDLSGGWRMRVYLARLLLQNPDMLLLDEPTNHLDLQALEWLEKYLLHFSGSVIIVSHDRFFIDQLAQEIYELDQGKLERYAGNYHIYEKQKEERKMLLQKRWEEQKVERKRQERFIRKFRYKATKAAQVQSRIKMLEKMDNIELPPSLQRFNFRLTVDVKSYKDVLRMEAMSFRYEDIWVLNNINLHLVRGDKMALVGINGAGKTTLARVIAGQLSPQKGSIQIGKNTIVGHYGQHQVDNLDFESSVYDEVASTVADSHIPRIRDVLGIFQFSGDDVFKPIKVLSGGEKARVSLAKILLTPVNFLIMDEPTNHLDMISVEALENALVHYDGTLLLISHDRYFLDKLVNRVIEIRNGKIWEYWGNYSYYMEKREDEDAAPSQSEEMPQEISRARKTKEQKRKEAEARQAISKDRDRLAKEIVALEEKIHELETRKKEIENKMSQQETYQESALIVSLQKEYANIKMVLEFKYERWEEAKLNLEDVLSKVRKH